MTLFKITYVFHVVAEDPTSALGKVFDLRVGEKDILSLGEVGKIEVICNDNIYNQNILIS